MCTDFYCVQQLLFVNLGDLSILGIKIWYIFMSAYSPKDFRYVLFRNLYFGRCIWESLNSLSVEFYTVDAKIEFNLLLKFKTEKLFDFLHPLAYLQQNIEFWEA